MDLTLNRVSLVALFLLFSLAVNSHINAQNAVNDRNVNTLNVFKEDSSRNSVLAHRLQPATGGTIKTYEDSINRAKSSISKAINALSEGNNAMALFNIHDALIYTPESDEKTTGIATAYYGIIHIKLGNHTKAVSALNRSDSLFRRTGDMKLMAFHYNNLGLFYLRFGNKKWADANFKKSLSISRTLDDLNNAAITLNHLSKGEASNDQKIAFLKEAIEINRNGTREVLLAENYNNLASIFIKEGRYKLAAEYLEKAGKLALEHKAVEVMIENYHLKSNCLAAQGLYKEAFKAQQMIEELREKSNSGLNGGFNTGDIEQMIQNRVIAKKNYEISIQKSELSIKKLNHFLTMVISLLAISILSSLYIYYYINSKRKLQCLESKQSTMEREKEYVESELVNVATFLNSRNEILNNIQTSLSKAHKLPEKEMAAEIRKINLYIKSLQTKNQDVESVLEKTERINEDFINKLTSLHPDLTKNDKNIALLLRAGLSTKQIATIFDCTPKSVNMARYRMRIHLGLESDKNLTAYLKSL